MARSRLHANKKTITVLKGSYTEKEFLFTNKQNPKYRSTLLKRQKLRAMLIKTGVLIRNGKRLIFTADYTFRSPSEASQVLIGRSSNGWTDLNIKK